jgi:2-keto-4-pentenoate hydratase/2-oxohepta-3-ene-1,7-dioic acid hydratase in catechol pathway
MKIAAVSRGDTTTLAVVAADGMIDLAIHLPNAPTNMIELITAWDEFAPRIADLASGPADYSLAECTLHAPIRRPGKIFGIGFNYADHAAETNTALPTDQVWFSKAVTSINAPFGNVQLPIVSTSLDYEAELVVVIGKRCRHVKREDAAAVIFGYCAGNDVSVRDWQFKTSQYILGKSFDTHAPIGPWIVTADALDAGTLDIRAYVNGEQRQSSNTRHLVFDCAAQIEHLSKAMTLEPGDLIFTGTPAGVGAAMKPPKWLVDGDVVRVEIDKIGAIENTIRRERQVLR